MLNLGYLNPDHLVGGSLKLDTAAAQTALVEQVAQPLGKGRLDAAWGVFEVACGTMVRAVKAVSTYRGRDPRDFALFAFGGNGPVVAASIAELLEMSHAIVPPNPGVYSAYGLLLTGIEHEVTRGHLARLAETTPEELAARLRGLEDELDDLMAAEGYGRGAFETEWRADMRYAGQAHELTVPVLRTADGTPDFAALRRAFGGEHERTYGHQAEAEEVESVTLHVNGRVPAEFTSGRIDPAEGAAETTRAAYFGAAGQVEARVMSRAALAEPVAGPLIVEEYDATCVVPPGWQAELDRNGNLHLRTV